MDVCWVLLCGRSCVLAPVRAAVPRPRCAVGTTVVEDGQAAMKRKMYDSTGLYATLFVGLFRRVCESGGASNEMVRMGALRERWAESRGRRTRPSGWREQKGVVRARSGRDAVRGWASTGGGRGLANAGSARGVDLSWPRNWTPRSCPSDGSEQRRRIR